MCLHRFSGRVFPQITGGRTSGRLPVSYPGWAVPPLLVQEQLTWRRERLPSYSALASGSASIQSERTMYEGDVDMSTMNNEVWVWSNTISQDTPAIDGFGVEARDGSIGKIDEATYEVGSSYIVVDTGPWIFGKKGLLPAGVVERIDA